MLGMFKNVFKLSSLGRIPKIRDVSMTGILTNDFPRGSESPSLSLRMFTPHLIINGR